MSGISGNYTDYGSLFTSNTTSVYKNNNSMYDIIKSYSDSSYSNYGANKSSLTEEQAASVVSYKNNSANVLNAIGKLMSKNNDGSTIFGSYKAASSNSGALSVVYKSDADKYSSEALAARRNANYTPEAPNNFAIKTLQLAEAQKNTSSLNATDMALETEKTYRFEISDGDNTRSYAFVTEKGDTNESVQKKMAAAINADKDSAVKATVSYSKDTGESYLSIEAKQTGLKEGRDTAFEIRDVAGYDAISKTGADSITRNAQNAEYLIGEMDMTKSTKDNAVFKGDPELKTSMSNEIEVNDRVSVTLKQTSEDFVAVEFERDTLKGVNAMRDFVNSFNSLYEMAGDNSDNKRSALLLSQLSGLAQTYSSSLEKIGITRGENGYLQIDEDVMKSAAESGKLEEFFKSDADAASYGFTNRLSNIAKSVNDNPTQYVGDSKQTENGAAKANNFWDEFNSGNSSYSKLYFNMQKYENIGSLFNSMF